MTSYYTYTMDESQFQATKNEAFQSVIDGLVMHGEITEEQRQHLLETYTLIVVRKGIFSKFLDKLFGRSNGGSTVTHVTLMVKLPTTAIKNTINKTA